MVFQLWEELPKVMRKARVNVNSGGDAMVFPQDAFVDQFFVAEAVNAANLEICCRDPCVTVGMIEWYEEG
jgi:hypothetical protein